MISDQPRSRDSATPPLQEEGLVMQEHRQFLRRTSALLPTRQSAPHAAGRPAHRNNPPCAGAVRRDRRGRPGAAPARSIPRASTPWHDPQRSVQTPKTPRKTQARRVRARPIQATRRPLEKETSWTAAPAVGSGRRSGPGGRRGLSGLDNRGLRTVGGVLRNAVLTAALGFASGLRASGSPVAARFLVEWFGTRWLSFALHPAAAPRRSPALPPPSHAPRRTPPSRIFPTSFRLNAVGSWASWFGR